MVHNKKVIVGLSGGVDSSVAAYLLKQQGYEVTGVTMALWTGHYSSSGKHACYGPDEQEEINEARELAGIIGIPYHVFDCSARYKEQVLDYFKKEYLSGRTPNPCIQCNQWIKFGMLPEMAKREGLSFGYFATGHYAKVKWDEARKRFLLLKGVDPKKDQTYFIHRLSQDQLSKVIFPLGDMTKDQVRDIAREIHIPLVEKEESQDFYSGNYKELLDVTDQPGNIVDRKGNVLGHHKGIWNYTIGQRKGLGIAFTEPLYVLEIDNENNQVIAGTHDEVMATEFYVDDLNWIAIEKLDHPLELEVKIRSANRATTALVEPAGDDLVKVIFRKPNDGITPGQSAVFYMDDIVFGGGIIRNVVG